MLSYNLTCEDGHKWYSPEQEIRLPASDETIVTPAYFVGAECLRGDCAKPLRLIEEGVPS